MHSFNLQEIIKNLYKSKVFAYLGLFVGITITLSGVVSSGSEVRAARSSPQSTKIQQNINTPKEAPTPLVTAIFTPATKLSAIQGDNTVKTTIALQAAEEQKQIASDAMIQQKIAAEKLAAEQKAQAEKLAAEALQKARGLRGTEYPWANASYYSQSPDSWGMYKRQCVSYAAWKIASSGRVMPYWGGRGNARNWDDNAKQAGIPIDTTPRVGDIAVQNSGYYGHVMFVEDVHADGTISISQYNADCAGHYSEDRINIQGLTFIHF